MAKPTEAQIRKLEEAHKKALANILQAIAFRYILYKKFGSNSPQWKAYADLVYRLSKSWYARQMKLEKGGATKEGIGKDDLFTYAGNQKLKELLKKWDRKGEGIGIIPLIVWAVVAIAGMFTASDIVDELNTTTEEQTELIQTSQDYCTKYNLDANECKKFMVQQTQAVNPPDSGLFAGMGKTILLGGLIFLLVTNSDKIFKSKTQKT